MNRLTANHWDAFGQAKDMRYAHYLSCSGKRDRKFLHKQRLNTSVSNCDSDRRHSMLIKGLFEHSFLLIKTKILLRQKSQVQVQCYLSDNGTEY